MLIGHTVEGYTHCPQTLKDKNIDIVRSHTCIGTLDLHT